MPKLRSLAFVAELLGIGFAFPLAAQPVIPGCPTPGSISCQALQAFVPAAAPATLSATTSSSRVALPATTAGLNTVIVNGGTVPVFVVLGDVTAVATTASTRVVAPGVPIIVSQGTATYLAGITGSSTATLTVYSGTGWAIPANLAGGSGGGPPTPVTQGTVPWVVSQPDVVATGTIASATPSAAYTVNLANGEATAGFVVTGLTASGATLTIEASNDGGTTWASVNGIAPNSGVLFTTLTTDQQFRVNTAGRTNVRLRVSSTGTGSITAASIASSITGAVALSSPLPANPGVVIGKVAIDQTTPGTTNAVAAGASKHAVTSTLQRPNNTTTYTGATSTNPLAVCASTSVDCAPITVTLSSTATVNGGLTEMTLVKSSAANTTSATFRVYAYQTAPVLTGIHDTSAFTPQLANMTSGSFLASWECASANVNGDNITYFCTSNTPAGYTQFNLTDGVLRFVIVATGPYVPAANETFTILPGTYQSVP